MTSWALPKPKARTPKDLPSVQFPSDVFAVKPLHWGGGKAALKKQMALLSPTEGKVLGAGVYGQVKFSRGGVHKRFKEVVPGKHKKKKPKWQPYMEGEHLWAKALQQRKFKPKHALEMQPSTGGRGIRMPFFRGLTLYNMIRFNLLKPQMTGVMLRDLRNQVEEISRLHFLMDDVHLNNIMVNPESGHAKFIDYGMYSYEPATPVLKLYVENLMRVARTLDSVLRSRKANKNNKK